MSKDRLQGRENKPGPEPELTPEVQERILERISSGVWWVGEAIAAEGFCRDTHYKWLRKGASGEEPYASYRAAVEKARAEVKASMLERKHALVDNPDPKIANAAIDWFLEKMDPATFGRRLEISASAQTPTREAYEAMTDEELEAEVRRVIEHGGDDAD